jgi:asparagine synthase (glutamine-hydrolysing)
MFAPDGAPLRHPEQAEAMRGALAHRGPDGHGRLAWRGALTGVTRLRVVDLDPRADQPFAAPDGGTVLACNGEIYNAAALRRRYADYPFRSRSDVEVILPLYLERGAAGLEELDGMFAIAILDQRANRLILARDRAGEKPLFLARVGTEWWWASEIGALLQSRAVRRDLDLAALRAMLRDGWIPEPYTPFAGVRKVPAGTIVSIDRAGQRELRYWQPPENGGEASRLDDLLQEAVARQVRADVPIGVFLSGGLDSSLLTALAAEVVGASRLRTFAVGFGERSYDERPAAERLAATVGTSHASVEVSGEEVPEALDTLAATGEPIADPAAVPTLALARLARRSVTVVLSGEGADELFGGYPTYIGHRLAPAWQRLPAPAQAVLRAAVRVLPVSQRRVPVRFLLERFTADAGAPWAERHLRWFANGLPPAALPPGPWPGMVRAPEGVPDVVAAAMQLDYAGPLRERLLVKVDRATMRASLEARAPYLDPALTRAALAAGGAHVRGVHTKVLLREVARRRLPGFILRRRKRGLSVPVGRWLDGPLASMVDRLLVPRRLAAAGVVDGAVVARMLVEHRAGRADHGRALWTLFVVQHWLAHWNLESES